MGKRNIWIHLIDWTLLLIFIGFVIFVRAEGAYMKTNVVLTECGDVVEIKEVNQPQYEEYKQLLEIKLKQKGFLHQKSGGIELWTLNQSNKNLSGLKSSS